MAEKGAKDGGEDEPHGLMPPADLRAALKRSGRKPASCVIGLTKDRQAVILLHRLKRPRMLLGEAKAQAKAAGLVLDLASLRFGRVSVSGGSDSAQAGFTVNKPVPPAVQQAMRAPMRAAGHPRFTVNADPSLEDDADDGADEADGDGDDANDDADPDGGGAGGNGGGGAPASTGTAVGASAGRGAAPVPPVAAPGGVAGAAGAAAGTPPLVGPSGAPPPGAATGQLAGTGGAPPAASPGVPALKARLTPLVKRMAGAVRAGQPGADGLRAAAEAAYDALQAGDLAAAGQGADNLERLLGGPAAATGGTPASPSPAGPAALTKDLAGLVKRIAPAVAADPSCQATLPGLTTKAHACLKSGDAAGAIAGIDALRQALDALAAASGVPGPGQAGPPPGGPAASPGADAPSPGRNPLADAMMQAVDQAQAARQAGGRPGGVQVAQIGGAITQGVAASLPPAAASLGHGRSPDAPPSLAQDVARRFERMQRRNRATLDEVGRGNLGLAASRLVGRKSYPPEVEDGYPPVPVRAPQPDAAPFAAPASPDLTGARVGPGPLGLPEDTSPGPASVASTDGAGTTQVRIGGMAAMTALDPGWAGATTRPASAAPPMAMPPEGFDAHPEAGGPTVLSTPQAPLTVPNHTGSPPPAVNLGDLREEFPALQPQGPTIMEARRSEQGSQAADAVPEPDANVRQPDPSTGTSRPPQQPYAHLQDPRRVGPGKSFTKAQKERIYQANLDANGGVLRSDLDGTTLYGRIKACLALHRQRTRDR